MTTVLSRNRPMCIDCGQVEVNIPTSDRSPDFCSALSFLPARFRPEIGGLFLFTDVDLDSWHALLQPGGPFSLRLSLCVVRSTPGQKTSADFKWGFIFRIKTLALFLFFLRSAVYRPQNPFVLNRMFSITSLFFEYGLYILSTLSWLYFVCIELTTLSWIYQALQRITSRATWGIK